MKKKIGKQNNSILMKVGDQVFWEEFNQREHPGERYVVLDTKRGVVIAENVKLVRDMKRVKAD
jgi:hypothetical protein